MRRFFPLVLLSLFLVVLVFIGTTLLAGKANNNEDRRKSIVVYTTLPVEQVLVLTQEYEKTFAVRCKIIYVTPIEADAQIKATSQNNQGEADIILAHQSILEEANRQKLLKTNTAETIDIIPAKFCGNNNAWVGLWYDPIIFAVNKDWLSGAAKTPSQWSDLKVINDYRLVITDFLTAEASANLLYSLVDQYGENETMTYLEKLHPRVIQYSRLLVTPARMVSLAEADIAIVVQSETMRYVKDGFPLKIIYPEDGTAYLLTGAAILKNSPNEYEAKKFVDWLLQDPAQAALQNNKFYFVPTNPETKAYKDLNAQNLRLFVGGNNLSQEQKTRIMDRWVQSVRLSPRQ